MIIYHYKITAVLDESNVMIVNLFTQINMDDVLEKENYMMELLDQGVIPETIEFKKINTFDSNTPYFKIACEGMMYSAEYPN